MKVMTIAALVGSLTACDGGGGTAPKAPTSAPSTTCSPNLPAETRVGDYVANISQTDAAGTLSGTPRAASGTSCNTVNPRIEMSPR